MDGERDVVTVQRFCCDDKTDDPRTGYVNCEIWKAGRERPDLLRDDEADRVKRPHHAGVGQAAEMLRGGSLTEAAAVREGLASGAVVLGGG